MNTNLFNIKLPNGQTLQQVANTMKQTVQKTVQETVQTCKTCGSRWTTPINLGVIFYYFSYYKAFIAFLYYFYCVYLDVMCHYAKDIVFRIFDTYGFPPNCNVG